MSWPDFLTTGLTQRQKPEQAQRLQGDDMGTTEEPSPCLG